MKQIIIPGIFIVIAAAAIQTVGHAQRHTTIPQHDVLILQGQSFLWQLGGEGSFQYQWAGVALYNADSSAGAPHYTFDAYPRQMNYSTNRLAQETANALDQGFSIKHISSDAYNVTVTMVRER